MTATLSQAISYVTRTIGYAFAAFVVYAAPRSSARSEPVPTTFADAMPAEALAVVASTGCGAPVSILTVGMLLADAYDSSK